MSMIGWDGLHEKGKRPNGIHPLASVGGHPESRGWMVGDPCQAPQIASSALIHAFCTIDSGLPEGQTTTVGERTFLQARVHMGHNSIVGDDCELCAGVVICGYVQIGDGVRVGGNAWIKPRIMIGDGAIVGGGSVVIKDIPAHEVWAGNPSRFLKLAWTHPNYPAYEAADRKRQENSGDLIGYGSAWIKADEDLIGYGSSELEQRQRAALKHGHGAGVAGDFA